MKICYTSNNQTDSESGDRVNIIFVPLFYNLVYCSVDLVLFLVWYWLNVPVIGGSKHLDQVQGKHLG